jgi:hypothetical protein
MSSTYTFYPVSTSLLLGIPILSSQLIYTDELLFEQAVVDQATSILTPTAFRHIVQHY